MDLFKDRMDCESIDDPLTLINKTGNLPRNDHLKELNHFDIFFGDFFSLKGIKHLYDVYFDGEKDFDSVSYSELFSIGCVVVPCNDWMRYNLALEASKDDYPSLTEEYVSYILDQTTDKYKLTKYRGPTIERVVFLPGSNIIEDIVDVNKLIEEVEKGALIKPHPLTTNFYLGVLKERFGKNVIIPHRVRGQEVLEKSLYVASTSNSELGLKALLMNKKLKLIDKEENPSLRPIFRQLYQAAFSNENIHKTPRENLLKILGSPKSCIIWKWENAIKLNLIYNEMEKSYATLSHTSN